MYSIDGICKQLQRDISKSVVLVGGSFDILHVGHIGFLQQAKKLGDVLVVGVRSDESVRSKKGSSRPFIPERQRAQMLQNLKCVDYTFITTDEFSVEAVPRLRPHVLVLTDEKEKRELNRKRASMYKEQFPTLELILVPRYGRGRYSSSKIIKRIQQAGPE